jgi:hypothetical protein
LDALSAEIALSRPDFLIVLSLERTGSTSVSRALRRGALDGTPVLHVHFLDGGDFRDPPASAREAMAFESKRQREKDVRRFLADPGLNGVVFTILRDRMSRMVSCLWYAKYEELERFYDPQSDRMDPDALKTVDKRIEGLLAKETSYDDRVYQALGLPGRPRPGVYRTNSGARLYAFDFRRIGEEFTAATAAVLGTPLVLPHENAGAGIGDPRGYAAFRRLCAEAMTPERLGLVTQTD